MGFVLWLPTMELIQKRRPRIRASSGVGGTILRGLVAQMHATMTVDHVNGTRVEIHLPGEEM